MVKFKKIDFRGGEINFFNLLTLSFQGNGEHVPSSSPPLYSSVSMHLPRSYLIECALNVLKICCPIRCALRSRHRGQQDGAPLAKGLRANGAAVLGDLDGLVRQRRRLLPCAFVRFVSWSWFILLFDKSAYAVEVWARECCRQLLW